jgi:hypothetical protein
MDEIIEGKDMNCVATIEGGFENGFDFGIPFWVDRGSFELGEKSPPPQIEPLDDEEDQEEVR